MNSSFFSGIKWHVFFAGVLASLAAFCFWTAASIPTLEVGMPQAYANAKPSHAPQAGNLVQPQEEIRISVQSIAASLGAAFTSLEQSSRQSAVQTALTKLSNQSNGRIHYSVWDGTRLIFSPLSPDACGIDFQNSKDFYGNPVTQDLANMAKQGGFITLTMPDPHDITRKTVQEAYTLRIPNSTWYIAAFITKDAEIETALLRSELDTSIRLGSAWVGASLLGIALLLLYAGMAENRPAYTPIEQASS